MAIFNFAILEGLGIGIFYEHEDRMVIFMVGPLAFAICIDRETRKNGDWFSFQNNFKH